MCFWNCQGVGHPRFHSFIREYSKEFVIDLLCLFETRISGKRADEILGRLDFQNSFISEAHGFSRGIWILWNNIVTVDIVVAHAQVLHMKIKQATMEFLYSMVYTSPQP